MKSRLPKYSVVYLTILLLIISPVLAQEEKIFEQDTDVDLIHPIRVEGGIVSSGLTVNITIKDPLNHVLVNFQPMTYNSLIQSHNYTLLGSNTSLVGQYTYEVTSIFGSLNETRGFSFEITPTGDKLSTPQGIIYTVLFILAMFVFALTLWGAIAIPWRNKRDEETGQVLTINDLKYFKMFCVVFSYVLATWIAWLGFTVGLGYLTFNLLGRFFHVVFWILLSFMFPFIVIAFIIMFMRIFDDIKIGKMIDRGISAI